MTRDDPQVILGTGTHNSAFPAEWVTTQKEARPMTDMRTALEALADEWERPNPMLLATGRCASRLRRLLADFESSSQPRAIAADAPTPADEALRARMRQDHRPVRYHWSQSGESGTVCAASLTGLHSRVTIWPCSVESAIVAADTALAVQALAAAAPTPAVERVTHGRHCRCTPCKRTDWTDPTLAHCGMHGPSCPPVYSPIDPPAPTPAVERCGWCGGSGRIVSGSQKCPTCGGTGKHTPPAPEPSAALDAMVKSAMLNRLHEPGDAYRARLDAIVAAAVNEGALIGANAARSEVDAERLARALDAVPWEPVRDPLDMVTYEEAAAQLAAAYREAGQKKEENP